MCEQSKVDQVQKEIEALLQERLHGENWVSKHLWTERGFTPFNDASSSLHPIGFWADRTNPHNAPLLSLVCKASPVLTHSDGNGNIGVNLEIEEALLLVDFLVEQFVEHEHLQGWVDSVKESLSKTSARLNDAIIYGKQ
jgi:hypothetical protein